MSNLVYTHLKRSHTSATNTATFPFFIEFVFKIPMPTLTYLRVFRVSTRYTNDAVVVDMQIYHMTVHNSN